MKIGLIPNIIEHLNEPFMDFNNFYSIINQIIKFVNLYDEIDSDLILKLKKTNVKYFVNHVNEQLVKELTKLKIDIFFNSYLYNSYIL